MGMESYNIIALPVNINIVREREYWKVYGTSEILLEEIESYFESHLFIKRSKNNNYWIYDDSIEINLISHDGFFQGIEMRGCLSYFELGIKTCYGLIMEISKKIVKLQIYVLNELINVDTYNDLIKAMKFLYKNKLDIFCKQYNNISLKVTCGDFYKVIKKRNKWYYKIINR